MNLNNLEFKIAGRRYIIIATKTPDIFSIYDSFEYKTKNHEEIDCGAWQRKNIEKNIQDGSWEPIGIRKIKFI